MTDSKTQGVEDTLPAPFHFPLECVRVKICTMKWTEVTWYSKLGALALIIILPFIGFYLGMFYTQGSSDPTTGSVSIIDKIKDKDTKTVVNSKKVSLKTSFKNGKLEYSGTVQLPSPCHKLDIQTTIAESYPEQVYISLKIIDPDPNMLCASVIEEKEFSGELKVSANASVSVSLNGERVR